MCIQGLDVSQSGLARLRYNNQYMYLKTKITDHPKLQEFLASHMAATIAVPVDDQGTLHAASLLYSHTLSPLKFYFVTARDSEKCEKITPENPLQCAAVIGTEKGTEFTVQMRGSILEIDPASHKEIVDDYYKKRGNHHDDIEDPKTCLLEFTPHWARFTDYAKGYERHRLSL